MKKSNFTYAALCASLIAVTVTPGITTIAATNSIYSTRSVSSGNNNQNASSKVVQPKSFNLNTDTLKIIEQAESSSPGITQQINSYISFVDEDNTFTESSFNAAVVDFVNKAIESSKMSYAFNNNATVTDSISIPEVRSDASMVWDAGILTASALGYKLTAALMTHAIESPGGSDTWQDMNDKYGAFKDHGVLQQATDLFEIDQVVLQGNSYTTGPNTYTYTSGDLGYALHRVTIIYAWVQKSDGTYSGNAYLTDTFDFTANDNDLSVAGVANAVAVQVTAEGYIKPFHVYIAGSI